MNYSKSTKHDNEIQFKQRQLVDRSKAKRMAKLDIMQSMLQKTST